MRLRIPGWLLLLMPLPLLAAPATGPVIENFGPVYEVPGTAFNLAAGQEYRVVMDVASGPDDPSRVNSGIESAARFLNMHARSGIDPAQLEMAVVLHGSAAGAALSDAAHARHFGAPNGSAALVRELAGAGVKIYLCGQSAAHRGFAAEELLPEVELALSAMTVHVRLQQEGYRAILF